MKTKRVESDYKDLLERKRAELERALGRLDEIAVETAADEMDNLQLAGEREFAISNLERETGVLSEVRAALRRIADHTYGSCLNCGQSISPARLSAVPWTSFCIRCQENADENRETGRRSVNELRGFLDQAA
jgi:DnaK suppressor protein